ncbi:class I SAM-dependent methyltransferase [Streptomyces xanthochromogenes]|uniref:class I SAM-dependent methyltransferase n=1 Tax=Streptomyces TaxID=1883 RepID=UPI00136CD239|nr:class I SAM-dependent methyltransferase [Streptomyces sp. SID1034]MYV95978.1 methyltransferase domain-containing protein [Streptomyces sp. SID1034]
MIINDYATAEYWDRLYTQGRSYRSVTSLETELFQSLVQTKPGMTVVEIGCGTGDWARALASMGLSVTGYDLSGVAIAEATKLTDDLRRDHDYGELRFAEWDIHSATPPYSLVPQSVDIVTCRLTIAFLDREKLVKDAFRWLKPRGVLHIVTPVHEQLKPSEKHRGLTEQQISELSTGLEQTRYAVELDRSITGLVLQQSA